MAFRGLLGILLLSVSLVQAAPVVRGLQPIWPPPRQVVVAPGGHTFKVHVDAITIYGDQAGVYAAKDGVVLWRLGSSSRSTYCWMNPETPGTLIGSVLYVTCSERGWTTSRAVAIDVRSGQQRSFGRSRFLFRDEQFIYLQDQEVDEGNDTLTPDQQTLRIVRLALNAPTLMSASLQPFLSVKPPEILRFCKSRSEPSLPFLTFAGLREQRIVIRGVNRNCAYQLEFDAQGGVLYVGRPR